MKTRGINGIQFEMIRSHGGNGDQTQNPYPDSDPVFPVDFDNNPILNQWDTWLNALDEAGITVYLFFYDDGARIWQDDNLAGLLAEQNLVTILVNRYEHLKHLVWGIAEEYSQVYSPERISRIAQWISLADDNDHPIANNQMEGLVFDHAASSYIDQFALSYDNTSEIGLHNGMKTAWNNAAGRYSLILADSDNYGLASRTFVRQKNWDIAMGGAYILVSGMDGTAAFTDKMSDCAVLSKFFETTDFNTMAPHDELGNIGTWVLADPGFSYIAYRDRIGDFLNETDFIISGMQAGNYLLRWLDPVSGVVFEERRALPAGTNNLLRPESFGLETAVWIKNLADQPPVKTISPSIPPLLLPLLLTSP